MKGHSRGELAGFIPKGLTRGRTCDAIQDQFEFLPLVANGQAISLFHPDDFGLELLSMYSGNDCEDQEGKDGSGKPGLSAHREWLSR
jgi:hypothetical protein